MNRQLLIILSLGLILAFAGAARADVVGNYLADSNQFGYGGTVSNTTNPGVGPWAIPQPRDAAVFFVRNVPLTGYSAYNNSNQILSLWYQHPQSDDNAGFFQIYDGGSRHDRPGAGRLVAEA